MSHAGAEASGSAPADGFAVGHVVAERYEILESIGYGMTGRVYRARDLHVDSEHEIVALKAVHPHLHSDRQIFGRFRREVKILRRLEGPHLCKLLDYIEEDGLLLIAIEYVDGPALDDYLEANDPLPRPEILAIATQVCVALQAAHDADIIHRDLKPANVLVERLLPAEIDLEQGPLSFRKQLSVRVVDFGLAKLVAGEQQGTMLTEQDMIFGTPDYMSPEQVSGETLDHRSDIYAAGVMLYEMVVGKVPFETPGALTTMAAHLNQDVPPPRKAATPERACSASLERIIVRALAKEPSERFESAADMAAALAALEDDDEPEDEDSSDTIVEAANTALSTTMESFKDEAVGKDEGKGGNVEVVVRDAPPASKDPPSGHSTSSKLGTGDIERRMWTILAIVAAVVAMAAGVWLGVR